MSDHEQVYGIKIVHEPPVSKNAKKTKSFVDIVAVHGIGAHPIQTWAKCVHMEGGTREVNWLSDSDFLPKVVPNCRIMTYGYESKWFGSGSIKNTASEIAPRFLRSLYQKRQTCQDRPLIFIAHCFGGLVVMEALADAKLSETQYPGIYKSTTGICFMGTPFRGAEGSLSQGQILLFAQIAASENAERKESVNGDILEILRPENESLMAILTHFLALWRAELPLCICFYETKPSNVWGIVQERRDREFIVNRASGTLDFATNLPLWRDHFGMNKFSDPTEDEFVTVGNEIKKLVAEAHDIAAFRRKHRPKQRWRKPSSHGPVDGQARMVEPIVIDRGTSHLEGPSFDQAQWQEESIPPFDADITCRKVQLPLKSFWHLGSAQASGVSSDCELSFLLRPDRLYLYTLPNSGSAEAQLCEKLKPPNKKQFWAVELGKSIIAAIINNGCYIRRISDTRSPEFEGNRRNHLWPWHEVPQDTGWEGWHYTCVAIHESVDNITVAFGMRRRSQGKVTQGKVKVYLLPQTSWQESLIGDFDIQNHDDSPKLLNFSSDGTLLVCTTRDYNQIHVWNIGQPGPTLICRTRMKFQAESDVNGITGAKCWRSQSGKPYLLCTTSPGSERGLDGGCWSFVAPASDPFPNYEAFAYHCLTQVQHKKYLTLHDGAISNAGNVLALVSKMGEICLVPLKTNPFGGFWSAKMDPIPIKEHLTRNDHVFMAALRFSPDGSRLVGVDHDGKVVIVDLKARKHLRDKDFE